MMVDGIRQIEVALGQKTKTRYKSENVLVSILGKSLATKRAIKSGTKITKDDLITKGPATGISANKFYEVLGKKILKDKESDEIIFPNEIG